MSEQESPEPLIEFLPAIRDCMPVEIDSTDVCLACGDCECGGACPVALYIVRQVMEALDHPDDLDWVRDYLSDQ